MMGEPVLREGYLVKAPDQVKYLLNFKKWQRRWCQLNTSGDLYIYENDKASKPAGVIHLLQCNRLFDAKSRGIQTSFCCGIDVGEFTFYLKAESAKSFKEWIKPMKEFADVCEIDLEAIDQRRGTLSSEGGRRGTLFTSSERERTDSVQSRHLSSTTAGQFPSKEGWLSKTGSNNKGWKDRYFKLQSGKLFYFKNERTDSAPLGDIDLFKCTSLENAPGKKGHGIDLHLPGRLYNLSAETREECDDWVGVLSHTLALVTDIRDSPHPRSESTHSTASLGSQDIDDGGDRVDLAASRGYIMIDDPRGVGGEGTRGVDVGGHVLGDSRAEQAPVQPLRESRDSVVQLLEAEVEALRGQVDSLQSEMKASTSLNTQLSQQLSDARSAHSISERELCEERDSLQAQVSRLEKYKLELETVNDSVTTQLEEQLAKVQELEEDLVLTRQDLEESQTANTAVEEELTDTQQRLQEIEQVAHELEAALRRRESEPATPLSTSFKGLSYQPHTDSEPAPGGGVSEPVPGGGVSESVPGGGVSTLEEASQKLEGVSQQAREGGVAEDVSGKGDLEEEKLKWQMEMETLRRELNAGFDAEREVWERERRALETDVGVLRERVVTLESHDKVTELEQALTKSQTRVCELESAVESSREKLTQLQMQKDKAVADLIALRKTNKSIEKRMSESEDGRVASPMNSLSLSNIRPDTPDMLGRIGELERRVEELSTALAEVQKERDGLQARVDRLTSDVHSTPDFGFKLKSGASVVGSSISTTAMTPPTHNSTHSSQTDITNHDTPPPKPKRPPRELMPKLTGGEPQSDPSLETRLRTRTASFIKSIKTMMM